jgi:hypothetical protein
MTTNLVKLVTQSFRDENSSAVISLRIRVSSTVDYVDSIKKCINKKVANPIYLNVQNYKVQKAC